MNKSKETIEDILKDAAENGDTQKLIGLLEKGAPFVVDMDGQTVLHLAAIKGHTSTVEALLDRGCDANIQDFCGHTSLQRAAAGGHLEISKLLLEHGASVDHQDELYGNTALHEAAWKGYSRTVNLLCKKKGNVYIKNRGGFTPLHLSCQNGHNQSCRNILITGCKPDLKNDYGDTPIHTAARYGHAGVIRILVSAACRVSEQNKNGDTALHISSAMGRKKLTRILLEIGINRCLTNKQGETALDIAMRKNLTEIINIFQSIAEPTTKTIETKSVDPRMQGVDDIIRESDLRAAETRASNHEGSSTSFDRARKSRSSKLDNRVNFKQNDPDTSDLSESSQFDAIKSLNKDLKRRQYKSKSSNSSQIHERSHRSTMKTSERRDHETRRDQRPSRNNNSCDCVPFLEKIGKRLENDKKQIIHQINDQNKKLDGRLENLESKTKKQILNFHQTMKECFAEERGDCQSRMDRLTLKERIELERQQAIRDILLKRDIARWLQAKMVELEQGLEQAPQDKAIMRKLTRRKSRRETRSMISDLKNGTLRRSNSAELISELGESDLDSAQGSTKQQDRVQVYRGLRISDKPLEVNNDNNNNNNNNNKNNNMLSPTEEGCVKREERIRPRIRHNSDGNYDDINLMQETIFSVQSEMKTKPPEDNIYENLMPLYSTETHQPISKEKAVLKSPPLYPKSPPMFTNNPPLFPKKSARQLNFSTSSSDKLIRPPLSSDTSSIDSHNDSGYSTRIAVSEGSSPPLGDPEPLLDPQALYMIPPDLMNRSDSGYVYMDERSFHDQSSALNNPEFRLNQVLINPKSSFV